MHRSMAESVTDDVKELPPSAKLVYKVLEWEGELTQKELIEETALPDRTVRHALSGLEEVDVVEKRFNFVDARQHIYSLRRT